MFTRGIRDQLRRALLAGGYGVLCVVVYCVVTAAVNAAIAAIRSG